MAVAIVSGAAGLVGSATVRLLASQGLDVVGIDNDLRGYFFGPAASTGTTRAALQASVDRYTHVDLDIRDADAVNALFARYGASIALVVHTAAQPSHDWAAREPLTDFSVNATGTLILLEATRVHAPQAVFIFTSTNKVYGDRPNELPLRELETRWEIDPAHPFHRFGIDESMDVDRTLHSLFGASKLAADVLVQEYGRYFGLRTACFRAGCLTGSAHAGAELHGFLAYLVGCAAARRPYRVFGYRAKQVRDNLHAADLAVAFWEFFQRPRTAEVYNMGGGRANSCSMLAAIAAVEGITGEPFPYVYDDTARVGDHIWWISDTRRFSEHYPNWAMAYPLDRIVREIYEARVSPGSV